MFVKLSTYVATSSIATEALSVATIDSDAW